MSSRDASDGSVLSANWEAVCPTLPSGPVVSRSWGGWFPIKSWMDKVDDAHLLPADFDFQASTTAPVTALWRNTTHLDLFVTGKDGRVMSNFWEPSALKDSGWKAWFPIDPGTGMAASGQPITAVWRNPNHLDLFMTGKDGRVMSTYFEGNSWQPAWLPIDPDNGMAEPGQPITALWRNPNHLDLFMTGKDGRVMSTFFEGNSWQPAWFPVDPETGMAAPGQSITAVWRNPNHLDLFMTGKDGRVMSTFFEGNSWQPAWFPIDPDTGMAAPGQSITAVWRNSNHLDLFMTGKDGQVTSTYFEGNSWQSAWFPIDPDTGMATPGQSITAIWRNPNHLDLFMTGKDGRVMSTYFEGNSWQSAWFPI